MPTARWFPCLVAVLDLGLAAGVHRPVLDTPLDLLVGLGALIPYDHLRVCRWRRTSVLVLGAAFSGALTLGILFALARLLDRPSGLLAAPWIAVLFPLPGHLLARLLPRFRPPIPVAVSGGGSARVRLALKATPGLRLRVVPLAEARAVLPAPFGSRDDHTLSVETPQGPVPLSPEGPASGMSAAVKRSLDFLCVALALIPSLPLMAALGILVRLTSRGPAFYGQERISLGERPFFILKLRSMRSDAEADGRPVWPEEHDTRITSLGRFLRRYWLDELPQLLNVLAGSMSLVGPRPERPFFVQEFSLRLPKYRLRHQVRAGITGLAQVGGYTGNTSLTRRLHLDLRYMRTWSPLLDLRILGATFLRAVRRPPIRGAR